MIGFARASKRQTESYWVTVFGVDILISYRTPVAFSGHYDRLRIKNHWGPTTGRHIREADADGWETVGEPEFTRRLRAAIARGASHDAEFMAALVTRKLAPELAEEALA